MSTAQIIFIIGSIGVFQNKAFLPSFLAAAILKFGPEFELFQNSPFFAEAITPNWFTAEPTIAILGFLSFLEFAASKDPHLSEIMQEFDQWTKSLLHVFTSLGLMTSLDSETAATVLGLQNFEPLTVTATAIAAPAVFVAANTHNKILSHIRQMDPENDWGLISITSYIEDLWVFFAIILLVLFPVVAIIGITIISTAIFLVDRSFRNADKSRQINCNCGQKFYQSISHCPSCGLENDNILKLGIFGQVTDESSILNDEQNKLKHLTHKRCSSCGFHMKGHSTSLTCNNCNHANLADEREKSDFLRHIHLRLPTTLVICTALGFIPVIGFIVGFVIYRKRLISPIAAYLSPWSKLGNRILRAIIIFTLAIIQFIPLVGAMAIPILIAIDYGLLIRSFNKSNSPKVPFKEITS